VRVGARDPADIGVIGKSVFSARSNDLGLFGSTVRPVFFQSQVVEARALQKKRAVHGSRIDDDSRARLLAGRW